jgi:hypothetical protein
MLRRGDPRQSLEPEGRHRGGTPPLQTQRGLWAPGDLGVERASAGRSYAGAKHDRKLPVPTYGRPSNRLSDSGAALQDGSYPVELPVRDRGSPRGFDGVSVSEVLDWVSIGSEDRA